jgi:diacylglycerol kinase family enzyme
MHIYTLDELLDEIPVIRNPVAGSDSKKFERFLQDRLLQDRMRYYETNEKGDAGRILSERIAEAEKKDKKLMALIIGGDGTYNDAVNAKSDLSRVIFVPIPGGTSSDVARSLNLNNTVRTCNLLTKIFEEEEDINDYVEPMDIISVTYDNGKEIKAMNLFSVGFDGMLCKEVNTSRKKGGFGVKNIYVKKIYEIIKEKRYKPARIKYTLNNIYPLNNTISKTAFADDILMFTIINGRYAGGGMNYNPHFNINDGALEGFLVKNMGLKEISKLIWHVLLKKDDAHIISLRDMDGFNRFNVNYMPGIESARINLLSVNDEQEYYFNVDGEHYLINNPRAPINVEVLPRATNVLYIPNFVPSGPVPAS